mgnify:CR=1 FL=1
MCLYDSYFSDYFDFDTLFSVFLFLFNFYFVASNISSDLIISYESDGSYSSVQRFILHTFFYSILRDSLSDNFFSVLANCKLVFSREMVSSRVSLYKLLSQYILTHVRSKHRVFLGAEEKVGDQERLERRLGELGVKELVRFRREGLVRKFHDVVLSDSFMGGGAFSAGVVLLDEILTDVAYDLPFVCMGVTCDSFCLARSEGYKWSFEPKGGKVGSGGMDGEEKFVTWGLAREDFGSFLEMLLSNPLTQARKRSLGEKEFMKSFQVRQHRYHGLLGVYQDRFYNLKEHDYKASSQLRWRGVSKRMLRFLDRWGQGRPRIGL